MFVSVPLILSYIYNLAYRKIVSIIQNFVKHSSQAYFVVLCVCLSICVSVHVHIPGGGVGVEVGTLCRGASSSM